MARDSDAGVALMRSAERDETPLRSDAARARSESALSGWLQLLSAAGFSGVVARSVVHPMDTLRTRMMAGDARGSLAATARSLWRAHGVRGFYRGFGVTITVQAPAVATYLTTYDAAKLWLVDTRAPGLGASSALTHLLAALAAESVSAFFWCPMEVVKQRIQLRSDAALSTAKVVRDLLAHEGPSALFRGYGLTLGVFGPYAMLYFVCYEKCKQLASTAINEPLDAVVSSADRATVTTLSSGTVLCCAAGSAAIAAAATTPLDVLKTRIQTQDDVTLRAISAASPQSGAPRAWSAAQAVVRESGLRGLFRGLSARVLWITPQTAITMTAFEAFKRRLANLRSE
mmetsp:Transcript_9776/g.26054  ORF Transcript_9776/g.26054 Transcript_9776/m.26054 type:complete len:344 (-) Transcript_9776:1-1032(-)